MLLLGCCLALLLVSVEPFLCKVAYNSNYGGVKKKKEQG